MNETKIGLFIVGSVLLISSLSLLLIPQKIWKKISHFMQNGLIKSILFGDPFWDNINKGKRFKISVGLLLLLLAIFFLIISIL